MRESCVVHWAGVALWAGWWAWVARSALRGLRAASLAALQGAFLAW